MPAHVVSESDAPTVVGYGVGDDEDFSHGNGTKLRGLLDMIINCRRLAFTILPVVYFLNLEMRRVAPPIVAEVFLNVLRELPDGGALG